MSRARGARLGGQELPLGSPVLAAVAEEERQRYLRRRAELAPPVPARERTPMTERVWQRQVVEVARQLGWWVYHPHLSMHSERGWPDLSLLHEHRGRAAWIECKTDTGQLTETQVAVIDRMLACRLEVRVFRPHDTLEAVARWLQ